MHTANFEPAFSTCLRSATGPDVVLVRHAGDPRAAWVELDAADLAPLLREPARPANALEDARS